MEECKSRKRVRDAGDSEPASPESKIPRLDSPVSPLTRANSSASTSVELDGCDLVRVEPDDSVIDSAAANQIHRHGDFLDILDDADNVPERDPNVQGLDSVIKSFEEEILAPGSDSLDPDPNTVPEFNPNLGYLLEASDDELGLPPTVVQTEEKVPVTVESGRVDPEVQDLTGFFGFEDDVRGFETFGYGDGVLENYDGGDNGCGYVMIDGLFDYSEPADILWRSESLQAM